ncbi:MAG: hypothetical protein HY898_30440 [Deltaproteobacteria bacterium]|nr:hypothetical protein [Deltaproteobacteria bacterium]
MRAVVAPRPITHTPRPEAIRDRAEQPRAEPQEPQASFSHVMRRLAGEVDRGESVVSHALRGNPYADDAKGMLALQAGVYRYVEAVDLVSKLIDRAAGAVKTTLQNQ